jgi:heme/copper-type cytochrome/quinol oxidase subunit 3
MNHQSPPETEMTSLGVDNRKLGIWTLIGSEAVFFAALILTYIIMRGKSVVGPYPHEVLDVTITAANTFILICSSMTLVLGLSSIQQNKLTRMRRWLIATIVLGLVFLGGQIWEFSLLVSHGLTLSRNMFGSTFYTLTGFHGAHVAVGVIWLAFVLAHSFQKREVHDLPMRLELAGLYWHFVDLVWILIFTIVYLI